MGTVSPFPKEKLILGVLYHDPQILVRAMRRMTAAFGPIEDMTEEFSFSRENSTYYDGELGGEAWRRIYSFRDPIDPARQAQIKQFTNRIEADFSVRGARRINLDPGFLSPGRVMLATTKYVDFRIPLADGIYTEMTLFWSRGEWHAFPWTYRDYQSERVRIFLTRVRQAYKKARRNTLAAASPDGV